VPKPHNIAELKTALLQCGMICHRSSLARQPCDFERDFDVVLPQMADTLNIQFKYREGSWHSYWRVHTSSVTWPFYSHMPYGPLEPRL